MQLWTPIVAAMLGAAGALAAQALRAFIEGTRQRRGDDAGIVVAEIDERAKAIQYVWHEIEKLRIELRAERDRVDALTARLEESRTQYLTLAGQHATLSAEHVTLKAEHAELQEKYEQVQLQLQAIRDTTSS